MLKVLAYLTRLVGSSVFKWVALKRYSREMKPSNYDDNNNNNTNDYIDKWASPMIVKQSKILTIGLF